MTRSYEPDADRQLDAGSSRRYTPDDLWSAYQHAVTEGWGPQWLEDHADCDLPPALRLALDCQRRPVTEENLVKR